MLLFVFSTIPFLMILGIVSPLALNISLGYLLVKPFWINSLKAIFTSACLFGDLSSASTKSASVVRLNLNE